MADALTPPPADDDQPQVVIETTGAAAGEPTIDPATGATIIHSDDGSVEIDLSPPLPAPDLSDTKFDANLAELLTAEERDRIVSELLEAIAADEQSRAEWLETREMNRPETPNTRTGCIFFAFFAFFPPSSDSGETGA